MASDRERVLRFEQEARAVAALNHPGVCTLHDVGNEDGVHYLVFEYLAGEPLSERLLKGAVPFPEALEYAIQIADAVACAHEQEIIHLDLKPSNIMLTRTGVKLLDFGIAELRHPDMTDSTDATGTNTGVSGGRTPGTLGYMAPEQLEGRETDYRTDIFAFGAVLYEMFTGRRAFPTKTSMETPTVPPAVDSLVARCLAQNPSERWQNVFEVLARLRDIRATQ